MLKGYRDEDAPSLGDRRSNSLAANAETYYVQKIFLYVNLAGTLMLLPLAAVFLIFGDYGPGLINLTYAVISAGFYLWLRRTGQGLEVIVNAQLLLVQVVCASTTFMLGGFAESGYGFVWALLSPMAAVVFTQARRVWLWFALFMLLLTTLFVFQFVPAHPMPHTMWMGLSLANLGGASTLILLMLYQATMQLRAEQKRSEDLLLNVLPKDVAEILKDTPRVVADYFPQASILFADIAGFTPLSAEMRPEEVVALLDEVFSAFDALAEQYGVEKIKTIGDCYMIAAGVPSPREDHAQALVRLALEMQALAASRTFGGRHIALRIGINSGPVVAGVIGRKKFIYDLWGDSVNLASRMESHGTHGAVQIAEATYLLVSDSFECHSLGDIDVKGCGPTPAWRVTAVRAATAPLAAGSGL